MVPGIQSVYTLMTGFLFDGIYLSFNRLLTMLHVEINRVKNKDGELITHWNVWPCLVVGIEASFRENRKIKIY